MTRVLAVVLAEPHAVFAQLRDALSGDGPAIMPHESPSSVTGSVPAMVEQRVALVVETSGSTARPKRVLLSSDALLASAAASESALGGPGQWLLALPVNYIAGLNVLVRSLTAQTEPVVAPANVSAESFIAAANQLDHARRFVSLVPAQLSRLLESDAPLEALRSFEAVLVGGQAVPPSLVERATDLGIRLTRTYGSSETSGGCVYNGVPIGDTRVRITDGRVELSGSVLAEGYLADPRRSAFAFREVDGARWYRTDDAGELNGTVLTVTGRIDDVIVSGGVKVSLSQVEVTVRGLPGLSEAVVVAAPHREWGETPVVVSTVAVPIEVIRDAVTASLGKAAAPARLLLLDVLPALPSGKPDRLSIATLALQ